MSNVDTSTEKPQAVSNVDTDMETTKQVSNIDTDTEGMILKADPVDTQIGIISVFCRFFIGSWSVLMFLTAIRKKSKKDIGAKRPKKGYVMDENTLSMAQKMNQLYQEREEQYKKREKLFDAVPSSCSLLQMHWKSRKIARNRKQQIWITGKKNWTRSRMLLQLK